MNALPRKLGIVAGGGVLPRKLIEFCDSQGIQVCVVAIRGQADVTLADGREHIVARLGAAGRVIKALREKGYRDLVLIGSVKRPHLGDLCPDLYTAAFLARLAFRLSGDDALLTAIRGQLEREGFRLHGIHELMSELLMPEGVLGVAVPSKAHLSDIATGFKVAKAIGALDIGQSIVIQDGVVLGVEGVEGTDELLRRCAAYRRTKTGGILVKVCKPQQDRKIDLPTIGPETITLCASLGYDGVAVESGSALVVDLERVIMAADAASLFITGVTS